MWLQIPISGLYGTHTPLHTLQAVCSKHLQLLQKCTWLVLRHGERIGGLMLLEAFFKLCWKENFVQKQPSFLVLHGELIWISWLPVSLIASNEIPLQSPCWWHSYSKHGYLCYPSLLSQLCHLLSNVFWTHLWNKLLALRLCLGYDVKGQQTQGIPHALVLSSIKVRYCEWTYNL